MVTTTERTTLLPRQTALAFERDAQASISTLEGRRQEAWDRVMADSRVGMRTGLEAERELRERRNASGQ